jgi:hypothetical protein
MAKLNIRKWMFDTYIDNLKLSKLEGSSRYSKFISSICLDNLKYSGVMRANAFDVLKYGYPLRRTGYYVAALSVKTLNYSSYYGYIYWPTTQLAPEYICCSSTFESRDGEYRHRFVWYPIWDKEYESLSAILNPLEEKIIDLVQNDKLALHAFLYPGEGVNARAINDDLEDRRLLIRAFVIILSLDAILEHEGTLEMHTHPDYVKLLAELWPDVEKEVVSIIQNPLFMTRRSVFRNGSPNLIRLQCGQKITPLTLRESIQIDDVDFAIWREIYVARMCSNLVINGIAPNFPLYNQWTYVQNADNFLFENTAMHEKYDNDAVARMATIELQKSRKIINGNFEQMDVRIFDAVQYAESFLLMSQIAISSTSEWVGHTIYGLPTIWRRSSIIAPTSAQIFSNVDHFASLLFGLCYGCAVLHKRGKAVHGDLHLNNMTYFWFTHTWAPRNADGEWNRAIKNPVIAFVLPSQLNGEAATYVLPHIDGFACIIDFSRAIIGPDLEIVNSANFYRNQVNRVFHTLNRYLPKFVEANQEKIKGAILGNFEATFAALTAVDFYSIGKNLRSFLEAEVEYEKTLLTDRPLDKRNLNISFDAIKLCQRLENLSLEFFIQRLHELIKPTTEKLTTTAGDIILEQVFNSYLFANWDRSTIDTSTLVDAYNGGNEICFNGDNINQFPLWARPEELLQHSDCKNIEEILERGDKPFLDVLHLDPDFDILVEKLRATISDPPAAATSSWIK